jgi:HlyD family secretion protein
MKWWKVLIAVVLLLGVTAITAGGLRNRPPPAVEIQSAKVRKGTITRTIVGAGKLQPATTVKISSNLSGDIIELNVKEGDKVTKGEILARIDPRSYQAAFRRTQAAVSGARADVRAAQVDVDRASNELGRVKALVDKGLASGAELDKTSSDRDGASARLASAQERLSQAQASLDEAKTNLSKTSLEAPMEGTVIQLLHEKGERLRGSDFSEDTLMVLGSINAMEVKIDVGERDVVYLKEGQKSDITIDALEGQTFSGVVTQIAQQATIKNPGTEQEVTSFDVTVAIEHRPPGVLPGMSGEVRISAQTHPDALMVPIQAVTARSEKSLPDAIAPAEANGTLKPAGAPHDALAKVVFVLDGDKVHVRRVKTGIAADSDLEILDGLKEGERIVEGPYRTVSRDLQDGTVVREATPAKPGQG